ncbi:MAG: hypothetical protein AAFO96_26885 [Bacteroidota bacterium]
MKIDITSFLKHGVIGDISVGKIFLPSQFAHGVSSDTHENGLPVLVYIYDYYGVALTVGLDESSLITFLIIKRRGQKNKLMVNDFPFFSHKISIHQLFEVLDFHELKWRFTGHLSDVLQIKLSSNIEIMYSFDKDEPGIDLVQVSSTSP